MFSKTTDGGVTWSTGRPIFDPGEKNQTIGNQIVVPTAGPAKGVLIDGFDLILNKGGKGHHQRGAASVAMIRSTDGGSILVAPDDRRSMQQVGSVSIAGTPSAAATNCRSSRPDPRATSTPSGRTVASARAARRRSRSRCRPTAVLTWSTPIRVDPVAWATRLRSSPQMPLVPTARSAVQLLRPRERHGCAARPHRQFIVTCSSNCSSSSSWSGETRLSTTGSFNILAAPNTTSGAGFVGDYDGLAPNATAFDSAFVMATPIATNGPTDLLRRQRAVGAAFADAPRAVLGGGGPGARRAALAPLSLGARGPGPAPLDLRDNLGG